MPTRKTTSRLMNTKTTVRWYTAGISRDFSSDYIARHAKGKMPESNGKKPLERGNLSKEK